MYNWKENFKSIKHFLYATSQVFSDISTSLN